MDRIDLGVAMMDASDVEGVRTFLLSRLDIIAEQQRQRWLTPGTGKAMEYLEARDQALAVRAMGQDAANALADHGLSEFPILAASVPIEAPTLWDAHVLVLSRYEQTATLGGAIKRAVLTGKAAIRSASDAASAKAAYEAVQWPTM